jgi:two-component system phosphate regulon response regulator PhoB
VTPYVLVVEDEDALATLLHYNLDKEGYRVGVAGDGEEALIMANERAPDLVILDWMLPKVSGIEVCRRLRGRSETRNVPIIMLTARGEESDRIRGLDTGADDYVVKPFSMVELTARVRAVLRRIRPGLADDRITVGDIIIDRVAHRVKRNGKEIHLGPTEFRLLDYLMQHPGRVFSREQLLDAVWGSDVYVEARTVDVHIGRLERHLGRRSHPHRAFGGLLAGFGRGLAPTPVIPAKAGTQADYPNQILVIPEASQRLSGTQEPVHRGGPWVPALRATRSGRDDKKGSPFAGSSGEGVTARRPRPPPCQRPPRCSRTARPP